MELHLISLGILKKNKQIHNASMYTSTPIRLLAAIDKMKKLIIFLGVLFLMQACTSEVDVNVTILENYSNGTIKSLKVFSNEEDTINYVLKEFYENGQLKKTGPIKDSIVNGLWHYYYVNGQLEMTGEYITDDSLNQGNYTYSYKMPVYNRDGSLKEEPKGYICSVTWAEMERENLHVCKSGEWKFYHENGQLKYLINFNNGWSNNYITEYYPSGTKKTEGKSEIGTKIGEWKEYYDNGQEKSITNYYSDSMRRETFWLNNGELTLSKGTGYIVTVDTAKYGDSIITEYVNYLKHGRNFTYRRTSEDYSKFHIWYEHYYKEGKITGVQKIYNNYGATDKERVSRITPYKDGLCNGLSVRFFDGDTVSIKMYINGKEDGEHISRRINTNKIDIIERWKMGVRHGVREYYDYEGRPQTYQFFYEGSRIGEIEFEDGVKISESIREGHEKEFNKLRIQTTHNKK